VGVRGAVQGIADRLNSLPPLRRAYLQGLVTCLQVMWDLAMERLGKGETVSYEACVRASTGLDPQPSNPTAKRKSVRELLHRAGYPSSTSQELSAAVAAWRTNRMIPCKSIETSKSVLQQAKVTQTCRLIVF